MKELTKYVFQIKIIWYNYQKIGLPLAVYNVGCDWSEIIFVTNLIYIGEEGM